MSKKSKYKEPLCIGCTVMEGPLYPWKKVGKYEWVICGDCVELFHITVDQVYP